MPDYLLQTSQYYQFKNFLEHGAAACFSNRNLDLGFGSAQIEENRRAFLNTLGINYENLACAQQPHGAGVAVVRERDRGKGAKSFVSAIPDCDALVTNCKNIPLSVFTADCLSIFLLAKDKKSAAIIHAGWRGSKERVVINTVESMRKNFGAEEKDLLIGFGPAIRSCCYEVKSEFKDYFDSGLIERNGKLYLDLVQINKTQLKKAGIAAENIFDCGFCTSCFNKEFFSFRKEAQAAGRMMSLIMLK